MATYFNTTDLQARNYKTATWIADESHRIVMKVRNSGRISPCAMTDLEYVVAALEVVECYTVITTAAQDGEDNCLTEAQLENIYDNISSITKLSFVPKGTNYETTVVDPDNQTVTLNGGGILIFNGGGSVIQNAFTTES